ncbi:MAG: hypothetical protein G01um101430_616 [Parcubacteria group bacterium Gr01-1014_30]|nr:MAG: hypothetical protein G01um101430_616 [Parcubacteria group bacterium Gr01-1014_30]
MAGLRSIKLHAKYKESKTKGNTGQNVAYNQKAARYQAERVEPTPAS